MSTQDINDFLTKQLFIEKHIVTYRSLSREFGIHVNVAKNELATYHLNAPFQSQSCVATYMLCGQARAREFRYGNTDSQDVEMEDVYTQETEYNEDEYEEGDSVPQIQIIVVNEKDLDVAKSGFLSLNSIFVYSLSPSPLRDAGLLCEPTEYVRKVDSKRGEEIAVTVGKIVGKNIRVKGFPSKTPAAAAVPVTGSSSNVRITTPEPSIQKVSKVEREYSMDKTAAPPVKAKEKPKPPAKMDFFKSKPKEPVKKEEIKPKVEEKGTKMFFTKPAAASKTSNGSTEEKAPPERGTKRKSHSKALSDTEEAAEPAGSKRPSEVESKLRVKKGVVLSDSEDDLPNILRRKSKITSKAGSIIDSEAEREAQALMDIDDDHVVRASREIDNHPKKKAELEEEEEEEAPPPVKNEDIDMADDVIPAPKARKRKEKKAVPKGSNGLKKKRITKSRTIVDDKGYMVTEDYSSYESVDEEEAETMKTSTKGKGKAKPIEIKYERVDSPTALLVAEAPARSKVAKAAKPTNAKSGKTGASKGGQKNLANFFGPSKVQK